MAHARVPGICDKCGQAFGSVRRFCKSCRELMKPFSNEYNKNNHGFSGLINQGNMEHWYFWAKKLLVDTKQMPETFDMHVAHIVKKYNFQVPPASQKRPRNYAKEKVRQEENDYWVTHKKN